MIAFLGPSLPAAEARGLGELELRPPARRGDIWRALVRAPRAIALVDGVFEASPSVWHHELRAALDAGVRVFGAASMGALRAAELAAEGMRGVGCVHAWVCAGEVRDDADVALLHAGPEHGWRGFTVPLVTVRDRAEALVHAGVLRPADARALLRAASAVHFTVRTWAAVRDALPARLRKRWADVERFLAGAGEDVKARDARECLRRALATRGPGKARTALPSAAARRQRLAEPSFAGRRAPVRGTDVLTVLRAHREAPALLERGLDRALLAGWARGLGLRATEREIAAVERVWLRACHVSRARRAEFWAASGLDAGTARRLCEDVALVRLLRAHAMQVLPDGPSAAEALLDEARLGGLVPEAVERVSRRVGDRRGNR
ncbi:MAG: TfuA-like protein [Myxococcaceae bacterium]